MLVASKLYRLSSLLPPHFCDYKYMPPRQAFLCECMGLNSGPNTASDSVLPAKWSSQTQFFYFYNMQ